MNTRAKEPHSQSGADALQDIADDTLFIGFDEHAINLPADFALLVH